ncbi:MAG: hypothetical protein ACYTFG_12865 [Planctomycetota bacterium]|jgi:hypothetical protein
MHGTELDILAALDSALASPAARAWIEGTATRVEKRLAESPGAPLAWEAVPLETYPGALPEEIRSSWVFVLRGGTNTGAERHSNSHQRMMAFRGSGDFQTRTVGPWLSHLLVDEADASMEERWISIPPGVWHRGIVSPENWVVVSFHTVEADQLEEERPAIEESGPERRRKYVGGHDGAHGQG